MSSLGKLIYNCMDSERTQEIYLTSEVCVSISRENEGRT
jgi:hypothetical protein